MSGEPIRMLMVGRHYWPHLFSDVASRTVRLADGLSRAGINVEVLTPRFASSWPEQICHREIVVHRPAAAPRSEWSMGRYLRHLENWLNEHVRHYDVLYSATMREEAAVVVETAHRNGCVAVVHHAGTGCEADTRYHVPIRHRRRLLAALQQADGIIVPRASTHQAMVAEGFRPERLHRISSGLVPGKGLAARSSESRSRARHCLAAVNSDLATHGDTVVVVVVGAMSESGGMMTVAETIPKLVNLWPDLRFWMIGDGPMRNELHRYLKYQGVRQNVAMPGTFVDLSEVLTAADLFVQCSANDAMDDFVQQAISASLPLVLADTPDTRAIISEFDECVGWCSELDTSSLYRAVRKLLTDPKSAQVAAERLRRELVQRRPYSDTIDGFMRLLESLMGSRSRVGQRRLGSSVVDFP